MEFMGIFATKVAPTGKEEQFNILSKNARPMNWQFRRLAKMTGEDGDYIPGIDDGEGPTSARIDVGYVSLSEVEQMSIEDYEYAEKNNLF